MRIENSIKNKIGIGGLTAVILIIISFALAKNTLAMPPSAVTLLSFTVTSQDNAALVEWETATEFGTAGFAIFRKGTTGDFADLSGFINATGDGTTGAEYSYLDETAVNGQTYTYQLREYESDNDVNELEEIQITIGVQPTATSITVGGGGSNNNPTATPIPTNTSSTATPTAMSGFPTATARATTTSPTLVPTSRSTAVSTSTSNTSNPTATRNSPTATTISSNNDSVVFAQGETPVPGAYPAEESTVATPLADSADYPADNSPAANETATPYPAITIEETTEVNGAGNNGTNVIGSGATDSNTNNDNADENADGSTLYLWAGFIIALLIFIAGLVGTAVLFTRKK